MYSIISFIFIIGLLVTVLGLGFCVGYLLYLIDKIRHPKHRHSVNRYIKR